MSQPIIWIYDGAERCMRATRRYHAKCDETFCDEQRYLLEPVDEVQSAQDRGFHARIREAWMQLPEGLAEQFPSPRDFRRHLLVACGFATTKRLRFASAQAALEALPIFAMLAATVDVEGAVVVVKTPMSQSLRGPDKMSKADRLRSYRETEELAAAMIGVALGQLAENTGKAA